MSHIRVKIDEALASNDTEKILAIKEKLERDHQLLLVQKESAQQFWEAGEGIIVPESDNFKVLNDITQTIDGYIVEVKETIDYLEHKETKYFNQRMREEINSLTPIAPSEMREEYIRHLLAQDDKSVIMELIDNLTTKYKDITEHMLSAEETIRPFPTEVQKTFDTIFDEANNLIDGLQNDIIFLSESLNEDV